MAKAGKGKGKDKAKSGGLVDNRKPKHSLDVNRPSNGKGGMRDAATVSRVATCSAALRILRRGSTFYPRVLSCV